MNVQVFTDLRFVTHPTPTGVGKHIVQMVSGLGRRIGDRIALVAARDQTRARGALSNFPVHSLPLSWKAAETLWMLTAACWMDRWIGEADWVYCPKNDFIPTRKCRVAVTVHGASELDPDLPQPQTAAARLFRFRWRTAYWRMLGQADLVLTVSEFLRGQIADWFGVAHEKIVVVGNGVESEFFRAADQSRGASGRPAERPYVLCVGGLNHLDGGDRVLNVAARLRAKAADIQVLVAGCQHSPELLARARDLPNLVLLGYVPSTRLADYMRDSCALFYPTRYETFGIASAEAMAAGTPVVTCRCTAVPEIVGDAAVYTSPDDPEEMSEALLSLVHNSALRNRCVTRGRERAGQYTWEACAQRLHQALER